MNFKKLFGILVDFAGELADNDQTNDQKRADLKAKALELFEAVEDELVNFLPAGLRPLASMGLDMGVVQGKEDDVAGVVAEAAYQAFDWGRRKLSELTE